MEERFEDVYQKLKWNGWGGADTYIRYDEANNVAIHINGKPMKHLLKFMKEEVLKRTKEVQIVSTPSVSKEEVVKLLSQPVINGPFVEELRQTLEKDQVRIDGFARLTHTFGKNYRDLWRVRRGMIDRAPDAVVLPNCHDDCKKIMELAHKHDVVIVPFGGGTNVTGGVEPNPFETRRMVVSVDVRRMKRMLFIDTESGLAVFEAGVLGPDMDEQLGRYGYMFGHDPDSYAHSTLGGWIAARGSGAMSNKYGDIENMIVSLKVVTPIGVVVTPPAARPCGVDLNAMFIGSEGAFGIVTEAVVKIERIPEVKHYEGWFFPSFEIAFAAFHACTRKGIHPCTMRLYDEDDTRLSFAASTDTGTISTLFSKCFKTYLSSLKGWDLSTLSLSVVGFEGTKAQTNCQRKELSGVFKSFGGICVGEKPGNTWQEKKYDLPYLRDFALSHNFWADVFETSVFYQDAIRCWRAVKKSFADIVRENGKTAWIGCHTAHQYRFGCCLYFTFIGEQCDENDLKIFLQIKQKAMEAMLQHKATLTHHHGIGYEHVPWMRRYHGEVGLDVIMRFKKVVDPKNICNTGKLLPSLPGEHEKAKAVEVRQRREMMFDKMGIPGAIRAHL